MQSLKMTYEVNVHLKGKEFIQEILSFRKKEPSHHNYQEISFEDRKEWIFHPHSLFVGQRNYIEQSHCSTV